MVSGQRRAREGFLAQSSRLCSPVRRSIHMTGDASLMGPKRRVSTKGRACQRSHQDSRGPHVRHARLQSDADRKAGCYEYCHRLESRGHADISRADFGACRFDDSGAPCGIAAPARQSADLECAGLSLSMRQYGERESKATAGASRHSRCSPEKNDWSSSPIQWRSRGGRISTLPGEHALSLFDEYRRSRFLCSLESEQRCQLPRRCGRSNGGLDRR